jgi:release factor glutamine methyltransferase
MTAPVTLAGDDDTDALLRARTFGAALRAAAERLQRQSESPRLDAQLLLARVAGASRSAVLAFPERELDAEAAQRLAALVGRRAAGEPLAYLLGEKDFYSLRLTVGPAVLVPRPETEHLVDEAVSRLASAPDAGQAALELGTGSGALALALKQQRPDVDVTAADSSAAALAIGAEKCARLGLVVRWIESQWFSWLTDRTFDVVLCIPPYVRSADPLFF